MLNIIISIIVIFLSSYNIHAACSGTSPDLTSASASQADFSDCLAVAKNGDTISLPSCGNGDCVWTGGVEITKDIKIVGAGIDTTYLTNGMTGGAYDSFFKFTPDETSRNRLNTLSGLGTFEVSGITFYSSTIVNLKYGVWLNNTTTPVIDRVKIHDNKFVNIHKSVMVYGYTHGVFYNNILVNSCAAQVDGPSIGSGMFYNNRMSLGSGKGWYTEDNTLSFDGTDAIALQSDVNEGQGAVARYNTVTGTMSGGSNFTETHGNQAGQIYGPQITEVYGNNITISSAGYPFVLRGGKGIFLNNVAAVSSSIFIYEEFSDSVSSTILSGGGSLNSCAEPLLNDGSGPRQTCTDSCICQKIHDTYILNNRASVTGSLRTVTVYSDNYNTGVPNNPAELVENIEYFQDSVSFDGTSGVGCGTLASRPATCTTGVGYWATTQSCSDLTGMVGASPSTPISGTLYKCTSTNTWTSYYTPYTYPHPLRGVTPTGSISIGSGTPHTVGTGGGVITLGN